MLAYKESGRRDMAEPFGRLLATALRAVTRPDEAGLPVWIVPAPSRAIASRRRGGPHMRRVAVRVAETLSDAGWAASVADCLGMFPWVRDSAGLAAPQRIRNLSGRIRVRHRRLPPRDARVVLIDDVITTGATVAGCVSVLDAAGVPVATVLGLTATSG